MSDARMLKKLLIFSLSFVAISISYQNCGSSSGSGGGHSSVAANDLNGDIIPIPNTKTASVQRASRVLDNLVSCLGTGSANQAAINAWRANRGTISEEGLANTMTQPMAKAFVSISAEVCDDLINTERGLQSNERKIFIEVDLDNGGLLPADLILASKRIARSCWGRNASQNEIDMIVSDISQNFAGGDANGNDNGGHTRNQLMYMCTAMASSFDAFNM